MSEVRSTSGPTHSRRMKLPRAGSGDVQLAKTEPCVALIMSPASDPQIRGIVRAVPGMGLNVVELQAPLRSAAPAIGGNVAALSAVAYEHLTLHCRRHVTMSLSSAGTQRGVRSRG